MLHILWLILQIVMHQSQLHIYTFLHYLHGIKIHQSGNIGNTSSVVFHLLHCPQVTSQCRHGVQRKVSHWQDYNISTIIDLAGLLADRNQISSSDDQLWVMHEDGWLFCASNRLIWIPLTIRNLLHHPHSLLISSQSGSAKISFKDSKLGSSWHECYTP